MYNLTTSINGVDYYLDYFTNSYYWDNSSNNAGIFVNLDGGIFDIHRKGFLSSQNNGTVTITSTNNEPGILTNKRFKNKVNVNGSTLSQNTFNVVPVVSSNNYITTDPGQDNTYTYGAIAIIIIVVISMIISVGITLLIIFLIYKLIILAFEKSDERNQREHELVKQNNERELIILGQRQEPGQVPGGSGQVPGQVPGGLGQVKQVGRVLGGQGQVPGRSGQGLGQGQGLEGQVGQVGRTVATTVGRTVTTTR